jgi:hypothetical protein
MNGTDFGASNRKQRRANGDKGSGMKRAKDAYVAAFGIAKSHGSNSPEFAAAFAKFEAAHGSLTDPEAGAFHSWQQTHVVAQNLQTGKLEAVDPRSMKHDPNQVVDLDVVQWFREIDAGIRTPQILESVPLRSIRPNPFVLEYREASVSLVDTSLRRGETDAWLVVASLPDGTFVDVDTPYVCEALKREGREVAKVTVVGAFEVEKCSSLGLMPWARRRA